MPVSPVVGQTFQINVTALDANKNVVVGCSDVVSIIILSTPATGGTITGRLNTRSSAGRRSSAASRDRVGAVQIEIIDKAAGVFTTLTFTTTAGRATSAPLAACARAQAASGAYVGL